MPYSIPLPFLPVLSGEDAKSGCVLLGLREFLIPQSQTSHLSWHFHPLFLTAALCSSRRYLQLEAKDKMTEGFLKKIQISGLAAHFLLHGTALGTASLLQMFQVLLLQQPLGCNPTVISHSNNSNQPFLAMSLGH